MKFFQRTLINKIFMALTGLFLAFFLVIHLAGNLQLLLPSEIAHEQYNTYSHILSQNLLIKLVSYVLYLSILYHVIDALILTLNNRKASGESYGKDMRGEVSGWISRNMGILGTLILIFLILHMKDYWYIYKFGNPPLDAEGNKDIYIIVIESFKQLWYVIIYVISMAVLGFHLWHGVKSAFRTLGLYHVKYMKWIKYLGYAFSVVISLGFALIPVIVYLNNV